MNNVEGRLPWRWHRRDANSWLDTNFTMLLDRFEDDCGHPQIERLAVETNRRGPQPLWQSYPVKSGSLRHPDQVRTVPRIGQMFKELVKQRKPEIIVEFGTAFGVSGMYWLAGLEENAKGKLLTFEPNVEWAKIAQKNLAQIGHRFQIAIGTFEDHVDQVLQSPIDIAFIDAIHTAEYLLPQVQMVRQRCSSGALILVDDINFSSEMKQCWRDLSESDAFSASLSVDSRVGILGVP